MSVSDITKPLADHLRAEYGVSDLLTAKQIKAGVGGLHADNLLDEGQFYDSTVDQQRWKMLTGFQDKFASILGKTITLSFDVTWSGYDPSKGERLGMEYGLKFKSTPEIWVGLFMYPKTSSGSQHTTVDYYIPQDTITGYDEGELYALADPAMTKITNPKIVINPMGGNQA